MRKNDIYLKEKKKKDTGELEMVLHLNVIYTRGNGVIYICALYLF